MTALSGFHHVKLPVSDVDLQAWCQRAEGSGIKALQEFSLKLRAAHA